MVPANALASSAPVCAVSQRVLGLVRPVGDEGLQPAYPCPQAGMVGVRRAQVCQAGVGECRPRLAQVVGRLGHQAGGDACVQVEVPGGVGGVTAFE